MAGFYAERFWDLDEAQNILSSLVKWTQEIEEATDLLCGALTWITVGCLGSMFLASFGGPDAEKLGMAAAGFFALGVVLMLFGGRLCTEHCELTFHLDGTTTMPRGFLAGLVFGPHVLGDHHQVGSVQMQETEVLKPEPHKPKRYEVWLYFDNGASFPIAESLFKQQAHQVAVLLEQALTDIRKAGAQESRGGQQAWADVLVE